MITTIEQDILPEDPSYDDKEACARAEQDRLALIATVQSMCAKVAAHSPPIEPGDLIAFTADGLVEKWIPPKGYIG